MATMNDQPQGAAAGSARGATALPRQLGSEAVRGIGIVVLGLTLGFALQLLAGQVQTGRAAVVTAVIMVIPLFLFTFALFIDFRREARRERMRIALIQRKQDSEVSVPTDVPPID